MTNPDYEEKQDELFEKQLKEYYEESMHNKKIFMTLDKDTKPFSANYTIRTKNPVSNVENNQKYLEALKSKMMKIKSTRRYTHDKSQLSDDYEEIKKSENIDTYYDKKVFKVPQNYFEYEDLKKDRQDQI